MKSALPLGKFLLWLVFVVVSAPVVWADQLDTCQSALSATMEPDTGHPWRPPFGLERVGRPTAVRVEINMPLTMPVRDFALIGYRRGVEIERHQFAASYATIPPVFSIPFAAPPDQVVLTARCHLGGEPREIARQSVTWPELEVDAFAEADDRINPVDLGTVLVPQDRLLLAAGQTAIINAAAFSRGAALPTARLQAWFEGGRRVEAPFPLASIRRATLQLKLPLDVKGDTAVLHIALSDGTRALWKKEIRALVSDQSKDWPRFGAIETKLRYDAPISVRHPETGSFSFIDYESGWNPGLKDVVIFLPNGSRFVFWRGASYVPFWAGRYNTGFSYQWAETWGAGRGIDTNEPLMDRELRYGRVRIVQSTPSRVHVQWTYPLSDFKYSVFGDRATEDFYFYPDGFGTRVLTLTSLLNNEVYQVAEFIILTPQSAYPLDLLPEVKIDLLTLNGGKRRYVLPKDSVPNTTTNIAKVTQVPEPTMYRVFIHKDDPATAIHFNPFSGPMTMYSYAPFYDRGQQVTPAYWGEHWPLGRGSTTGAGISNRIALNPSHNSVVTWFATDERGNLTFSVPELPLFSHAGQSIDALGHLRVMETRRWTWLIAQADLPDEDLRDRGKSFSAPPDIEVAGARLDDPAYTVERRALRLVAENSTISIKLTPQTSTVNPVFEIAQAGRELVSVAIDGKHLATNDYAWDGSVLWINRKIDPKAAVLALRFE